MVDSKGQKRSLIDFSQLASQADLPAWIGTTPDDLQAVVAAIPELYRQLVLPKRSGGTRLVYELPHMEPLPRQLRAIQRTIARSIVATYCFPPCVFGVADSSRLPRGERRSPVNNARQHLGRKEVIRCDLADFFDQIRTRQVRDVFVALGASGTAVDCLTSLCTLNGSIPQGASSSPVIANIAARSLDQDLAILAKNTDCTYTRYVDDIIFSGEPVADASSIISLIESNGFKVNDRKTRLLRRGRPQHVTGLNISDPFRVHVPAIYKRRLRSMLRLAVKRGFQPGSIDQLRGMLAYVRAADYGVRRDKGISGDDIPTFGDRMLKLFQTAVARHGEDQGKLSSIL